MIKITENLLEKGKRSSIMNGITLITISKYMTIKENIKVQWIQRLEKYIKSLLKGGR